jgi:hypothetical protein
MPWCPDCRTEYDPGVAACSDCGADLVDELPQIRIGSPPEVVYAASTAAEAQIVEATLEFAGIPAFVQPTSVAWPGENITDFDSPDLEVLVPADRLVEAQAVLHEQSVDEEELGRLADSTCDSSV